MPLYLQNGKLIQKAGKLGTSAGCCCNRLQPCSRTCNELIGKNYPNGFCGIVVRSETVCRGNYYFQQTEQYGDCNATLPYMRNGPCSTFTNIPSSYTNCSCITLQSYCTNYALNIEADSNSGFCYCLKHIEIYTYRDCTYVYDATRCKWIKVYENVYNPYPVTCQGFGTCACPDPPTCTPPPLDDEYPGCTSFCNPFP